MGRFKQLDIQRQEEAAMSLTDHDAPDTRSDADIRLDIADRAVAALTQRRDSQQADALHEWIVDGIVDELVRNYPDVLEELAMRWSEGLDSETVERWA